jgi:hypothetical protein
MVSELRAYEDRGCTIPLKPIDFGVPFVGTINERVIWIKNHDPEWKIIDISLDFHDENITVDHPTVLEAKNCRAVRIFWKPSVERRKELDTEKFMTGRLIVGLR